MLGRALYTIVAVMLLGACTGAAPNESAAAPPSDVADARAELAQLTRVLGNAHDELSRLESALSATRMERDARVLSRQTALTDQSRQAQILDQAVDASRREFAEVLGANDELAKLRTCAQALDTALNEAAVSGPLLADVLHDAQRACNRADVVVP